MGEIEEILGVDLTLAEDCTVGGPTPDCQRREVMKLIKFARAIQQSLPDDLEERREAAAKFLADRRRIEKDTALHSDTDYRLCNLWAGIDAGSEAEMCAAKRLSHIHTGDFSAESEYYPPEPDYPSQWLEHMSEESAEWLYWIVSEKGFYDFVDCDWGDVVKDLIDKDLLFHTDCPRNQPISVRANKAPFLTGGLELP